jgi:hypothetical protein
VCAVRLVLRCLIVKSQLLWCFEALWVAVVAAVGACQTALGLHLNLARVELSLSVESVSSKAKANEPNEPTTANHSQSSQRQPVAGRAARFGPPVLPRYQGLPCLSRLRRLLRLSLSIQARCKTIKIVPLHHPNRPTTTNHHGVQRVPIRGSPSPLWFMQPSASPHRRCLSQADSAWPTCSRLFSLLWPT